MRIILGTGLARTRSDDSLFDELHCNRRVLLEVLEQRLGLAGICATSVQRIVAYREALAARLLKGDACYRQSLELDPLSVSEELLKWRDELVLAGWDRSSADLGSGRLEVLAEIETHVSTGYQCSEGDRLLAVVAELSCRSIGEVTVISRDPLAWYPKLWQRLLSQLEARYESVAVQTEYVTDLQRLQASLSGGNLPLCLSGDGTVRFVTAQSETTVAEAAAELIGNTDGERVIVTGDNLHLLEQALRRRDIPIGNVSTQSSNAAIVQLLPTALALCWEPLDLTVLSEFLLHSASPVGGEIGGKILAALRDSPGIGGRKWIEALAGSDCESTRGWIEAERTEPSHPDPSILSCMADRVAAWAQHQLNECAGNSDQQLLWECLRICAIEFGQQVRKLDCPTRVDIERLLDLILHHNPPVTRQAPELGHVPVTNATGITDRVETVFWWGFSDPVCEQELPWTPDEMDHLRSLGIFLETQRDKCARREAVQQRAFLAAEQKLVLFVPQQRDGTALPEHPLWSKVRIKADDCQQLVIDVDAVLGGGKISRFGLQPVSPKLLPTPERWLQLPPHVRIRKRACESYSSVAKFIHDPFAWVCEYAAKLSAGPTWNTRVRIDQRLHGQVLHRLIERLFPRKDAPLKWQVASPAEIQEWLQREWPTLLQEKAMPLLRDGNRHHALSLKRQAEDAVTDLVKMLRGTGIVRAVADWHARPQEFFGGRLAGNIDLLGWTDIGRPVVVDFKLNGQEERHKEVADNRALQLAIYGYLAGSDRFAPPPIGAYYIVENRAWITDDEEFFFNPGPATASSVPSGNRICWRSFQKLWHWRREQLDEGAIELVGSDAESTPESASPAPGWPLSKECAANSEFTVLHGFGESL